MYLDIKPPSTRRIVRVYLPSNESLGEDEIEFAVEGMTVLQVYTVEKAMKKFGIEMTHDHSPIETVFYADVSGLRKILEGEE